jgi:hypothetical protein
MTKTLNFIYAIILFISLCLTTEEIVSYPNMMRTFTKCETNEDCIELLAAMHKFLQFHHLECKEGTCHVIANVVKNEFYE